MSRSSGYYGQSIGGHGVPLGVELFYISLMTLTHIIVCYMHSQVTGSTGLPGYTSSAVSINSRLFQHDLFVHLFSDFPVSCSRVFCA